MTDHALAKQLNRPISELVRHRKPMLLLDRLVDAGDDFAVCEWQVSRSNLFYARGLGVPSYVGVEYMAQCIAVLAGVQAFGRGQSPPLGYLLGTRHFHSTIGYFVEQTSYRSHCRELIRSTEGMGSFDCQITRNNQIIAEARLAVFETPQKGNAHE